MRYLVVLLLALTLVSCTSTPEPDIKATVAAALAATQTAAPTATRLPPTATPEPPTATPSPKPTHTPTAEPTSTPTSVPSATPSPGASPAVASSITETKLETGETRYELPQEGFSIALPADWQVVDLAKMNFPEALEAMGKQNESLKGLFSSDAFKNLVAAGIKFYAINVTKPSLQAKIPATINVLIQELPFEATLEMYTMLNTGQLKDFVGLTSEVVQEPVKLGDTEATKLAYTAKIVDPLGRNLEISNTQYLMVKGSLAYVVTLSLPVELKDKNLSKFLEAVETFRLME